MRLIPDSTNVEWVDYNQEREVMNVKFKSGYLYTYYDVTREQFNELASAQSIGSTIVKVLLDNPMERDEA